MVFLNEDLFNEGYTGHYRFYYEDTLGPDFGGPEPARTSDVVPAADGDFDLMSRWFENVSLGDDWLVVNVADASGGAARNRRTVTVKAGTRDATFIRYALVSEIVEMFMHAQKKGWYGRKNEGSQGEGLSRFLGAQFLAINGLGLPPSTFYNSNDWLDSSRENFVENIQPDDYGPDAATGCSLLFIYYLFAQLGFSIEQIIAAGSPTLTGVYRNLTGDPADPFPFFRHLMDTAFPGRSQITSGNLDNPFPLLFVFVLGTDGVIRTAMRPGSGDWRSWSVVEGAQFNQGTPITAVRGGNAIDIFAVGTNGMALTAWRDAAGWHWRVIEGARFRQATPITAVRHGDELDIFVLGEDGMVRTAFRDASGWQWNRIEGAQFHQGNPITAIRHGDELDIFVLGQDGMVRTAFRGANQQWSWDLIGDAQFHQGNPITAVRHGDEFDIFVLGQDGMVRTASRGADRHWSWNRIEGAQFHQGNPITAIRHGDEFDIFVLGQDGVVRTASRSAGWGWLTIDGARFTQGSRITAVRSGAAFDIFVLGEDNMVRTAFRDAAGWHWNWIDGAAFNQGNAITVYGN